MSVRVLLRRFASLQKLNLNFKIEIQTSINTRHSDSLASHELALALISLRTTKYGSSIDMTFVALSSALYPHPHCVVGHNLDETIALTIRIGSKTKINPKPLLCELFFSCLSFHVKMIAGSFIVFVCFGNSDVPNGTD